ncbi:MAG TPA: peptidylprolyl isomerase, partial [Bacteroidetes bacterium]|nr:peptidylprolyl isomerase [Bacteroidota bacterium]
ELVEKTQEGQPLEFIFGVGMMLPQFEENLKGKEKGDKFEFKIEAANGYGLSNPENVIELPNATFERDGKIEDGLLVKDNVIAMQDNQGNRFNGRVEEVKDDSVVMDFNHPMADKDLYFKGEILDVRDATPEELDHGHVHSGGHHHH